MEALGIAASIIAVLQLTSKVVSICYDYRCAARDSTWELPLIIREMKSLRDVLETLEKLVSEMDDEGGPTDTNTNPTLTGGATTIAATGTGTGTGAGNVIGTTTTTAQDARARLPTLQLLCKSQTGNGGEGGLLDLCHEELSVLKDKIAPPRWIGPAGSRRRAMGLALRWPLNRADTVRVVETLGRFRDLLTLALSADQATLVLKIEESVRAIKDSTASFHEELGKLTDSIKVREIDEHLRRIHKWLEAPDPSANHVSALGKRELKTGSWFIGGSAFENWKTRSNSFLWLHGIPGCGKTILSSTIIQAVHEHCNLNRNPNQQPSVSKIWAVAYFYFDFSDTLKQDYNKMIRSLIKQLSEQLHYTSDALEKLFTTSTSGSGQPPTDEALLSTLGQIIEEFDHVYIILDALDECKDRASLLDGLAVMNEWDHEVLHILVTSRDEKDIADEMETFIDDEQKIPIHKNFIEADIREYVYSRLRTDRNLKRWRKDEQVQLTIATKLTEKADGMFRWAACQLDELKSCFSRRDLQVALESLPKNLDDTYTQILCRIDEDRSETVLKILQWLAYSARPLQIDEVAEIVTVQVDNKPRVDVDARFLEPRDILTICSSLVTTNLGTAGSVVGTAVGEQIKLAHLSVKDYLVSKRILDSKAKQYSIQERRAHEAIAQICLAYLLQFDDANLESVGFERKYPLARYAAEFWPYHVRASGQESEQVVTLIMELFNSVQALFTWTTLFDSDLESPEGQLQPPEEFAEPLYYAAQAGLQKPVKLLLEKGAKPNRYGGVYGYALQAAAAAGFHDTVRILFEGIPGQSAAKVDVQGGAHHNALQAACVGGHFNVVEVLLQGKADVNIDGGTYANPLQAAAAGGHLEIVKLLIQSGAVVDAYGGQYSTSLIAAAFAAYDKVVETLLENGADIELSDRRGRSALSQAASAGETTTVKLLIQKGADVNHEDKDAWAPLDEAAPGGHFATVVELLKAGARIDAVDRDDNTALHFVASQPYPSVVRLLLEQGASQSISNDSGSLPIHSAAWAGRYGNVEALIEYGADINAVDNYLWTPLHAAIALGHEKIVKLLLEKGALFTSDCDGWSVLHIAVLAGNENMLKLLLECGANLQAEDKSGLNPHHWARFTADELNRVGYAFNCKAKNSFTITGLRIAACDGEDARIRQLLRSGADIDAKDDGGWSALLWAACEGHRSTMQLLIMNGADVNTFNDAGTTIMNRIDLWRDDALLELVNEKFDYEAINERKRMLGEKRERIKEFLDSWKDNKVAQGEQLEEEQLPPYEE